MNQSPSIRECELRLPPRFLSTLRLVFSSSGYPTVAKVAGEEVDPDYKIDLSHCELEALELATFQRLITEFSDVFS